MNLFTKWILKASGLSSPDRWLVDAMGGGKVASGTRVNERTALQSTAVMACVRIISETVASLPLLMYQKQEGGGKERAPNHPLYSVLHDIGNDEMTAYTLREVMQGHLCTWGNTYCDIERDNNGRVVALWPLRPDKTQPQRNPLTKKIEYLTIINGEQIILPFDKVMHIPGFGFDGIVGYSPIAMAREAIGLALATEEYGARYFGNGAKPGGVLTHPKALKKESKDSMRDSWNEMHQGLDKQHRVAILEEGVTYTQIGLAPEDSQFLETRQFQLNEIARIFRVPPHKIGDLSKATFSNIEQQSIDFVTDSIRPWLVRWEQSIKMNLLPASERKRGFFAEHLVDAILRGDINSRYTAYATGRQNGWLSADDIRALENMNPLPDGQGKVYLVNGNMIPADQAGKGGDTNQ
jgi:HK97 family phage portal protein